MQNESLNIANLKLVKNIINPSINEVRAHKLTSFYPWPAPSPYDYRLPSSVIHVPKSEINTFLKKVVSRYIRTIKNFTIPFFLEHSKIYEFEHISDEYFSKVFSASVFSRMICRTLDHDDMIDFFEFIEEGKIYHKIDFEYVKSVTTFSKDLILTPTKVLVEVDKNLNIFPVAIKAYGKTISKKDKNWGLCKTYTIQNAQMRTLISEHPKLHFPVDAFVGASHCILNHQSTLYKLLKPHFYMQLPLNFAVLYISKSVAINSQDEIYTPFCNDKNGLIENLKAAYIGLKGNSAYPSYKYRLNGPSVFGRYGQFLDSYYEIFYEFVSNILNNSEIDEANVKAWAHYMSFLTPGFPTPDEILKDDNLIKVVANFLINVSVEHSCDHYNYNTWPRKEMPLRLRKRYPHNEKTFFVKGEDIVRHELANEMYFKTHTLIPLIEVEYDLNPELQESVIEFKRKLIENDIFHRKGECFIPLSEIASSIQF